MKGKTGKRIISLLLVCAMVFTPVTSQAAGQDSVQYVQDADGNRTGIKSAIFDGLTYYDIYDGAATGRTSLAAQVQFLMDVVGKEYEGESLQSSWAELAYAIFASRWDYAHLESETSRLDSPSSKILEMLSRTDSHESSLNGKDDYYYTGTGLQLATSMSAVRNRVIDIAYEDAYKFTPFFKNGDCNITRETAQDGFDDNDLLSELDDDTYDMVLYSIADYTDYGTKGNDDYINNNIYGIAFYDFELQVMANDELQYITAAQGYDDVESAANSGASGVTYKTSNNGDNQFSYYQNGTTSEAEVGMEFTQSDSLEVSNSMEETSTYEYSSMIGSETKLGVTIKEIFSMEETFKAEFTTSEALSTAYSESNSAVKETSSTVTTTKELPAQTAVSIESYTGTANASLDYDCPVAITYKVAVFSCSPQWADLDHYWDSRLEFTIQNFSSLSTRFGSAYATGGLDAMSNLYNRAITYPSLESYDRSYGQVVGRYRGGSKTTDYLNWNDILNGVIDTGDLEKDSTPIYIKRYEVNTEGDVATPGDLIISDIGAYGYIGYETSIGVTTTYSGIDADGNDATYSLYTGPVYDANGNDLNADLEKDEDSDNYYTKKATPWTGETCSVTFYYTKDEGQPQTASLPAPDEDESTAAEVPEEIEAEAPVIIEETENTAETQDAENTPAETETVSETVAEAEESETPEGIAVAEETAEPEEAAAAEEPVAEESAAPEEMAAAEEPVAEEVAAPEEITVAEEPVQPEDTTIAGYAAAPETEEIVEAEEPAEPEPVEVYEEPAVSYEDDIIIEDGDLIGSVSNGGTVAGIDSTGSSAGNASDEPTLTIESIEVVESAEIPEELQDEEDTEAEEIKVSTNIMPMSSDIMLLDNDLGLDINADVSWIVTHKPMSVTGATLDIVGQSMTSEIYDMVPVYPLDYTGVTSDQKIFNMISGTTMNVDNIVVEGFNANDVEYYGFNQDKGYWVLVDEDGNELEDSPVASLSTNANTGVTLLSADGEGTVYLKYMIDESTANYSDMNGSDPARNKDLSSAATVQINVAKGPFNGTVNNSGTLTGYANETDDDYERLYINLDNCDTIKATVYDETGKKISNPAITWEAQEDEEDGIILEDDQLYFTKPGTYHIRAVYGYSTVNSNPYAEDWLEIEALPEKKINKLTIADETSPATLSDITIGEGKETVNLGWLTTTAKDQYNLDWTKLQNLKWYVDGKEIKANDAGSYLYTATEADGGTHTIYAMCDGVKSNELTLTVYVPATSVKLSKKSMSLKTGKTKALEATMSPSGTTDTLTWKSSDKKVATVNEKGEVTGVGAGTATITAKATSGKSASCEVTVTMSKGDTFTKGAYTYVVKDASTDGKGKVYMTGFAKGQSKKKVAVPDTVTVAGTTYKVTAIANEAFKGNSKITSFTSGANLTTIGKSAFEGCSKLKTVDIGNSVKRIEFKAFYDCYKLKTLSIGKNVNFMGAHCFCNDYKLQKITIKTTKLKAKNVESPHVFINVNKAKMKVPKSQYKAYTKLFTAREFGGKITK